MLKLITAPANEPLTLDQLKVHLRIDPAFTAEDDYIAALGAAAREYCEIQSGRQFVPATYELDCLQVQLSSPWNYLTPAGLLLPSIYATMPFPRRGLYDNSPYSAAGTIELPKPPYVSITSVKYYDASGTLQTMSNGNYRVATDSIIGKVIFLTLPQLADREDAIQITYVAGYENEYGANVPARYLQAIMLLVGELYYHREITVVTAANRVPAFDLLLGIDTGTQYR